MKIQRKIAALLCCLAFVGMLSLEGSSGQAAVCTHETWFEFFDCKTYSYEEDGHYGEGGPTHVCANCGYQEWVDSDLVWMKIEDHKFIHYTCEESTSEYKRLVANCETPECPYQHTLFVFN